jgi:hypothetical protein
MTLQQVIDLVEGVKSDFEREEDQALLQHDLHKAEQALAGKYACERIVRAIEAREGIRFVRSRMSSRAR